MLVFGQERFNTISVADWEIIFNKITAAAIANAVVTNVVNMDTALEIFDLKGVDERLDAILKDEPKLERVVKSLTKSYYTSKASNVLGVAHVRERRYTVKMINEIITIGHARQSALAACNVEVVKGHMYHTEGILGQTQELTTVDDGSYWPNAKGSIQLNYLPPVEPTDEDERPWE